MWIVWRYDTGMSMSLPRLIATTAAEAVAALRERRGILLDAAADALDLAESFAECGYPDLADQHLADARDLFAQAERHTAKVAA